MQSGHVQDQGAVVGSGKAGIGRGKREREEKTGRV